MSDKQDETPTTRDPERFGLVPKPTAPAAAVQPPIDTFLYDPGEDSPASCSRRPSTSTSRTSSAPRPDVERVAHFRVIDKIGEGGMGCVYRAMDEYLQRVVALKVLMPTAGTIDEAENMQRLLREARAASRINHPNVVTVYAAGESQGHAFIAMEHVEGRELQDLIGPTGLDVERALSIAQQIALGLGAAHRQGLIHRDVKPANVLVCEGDRIKILDFGLAKPGVRSTSAGAIAPEKLPELDEALDVYKTQSGVIWGSLYYMSPEQACGSPLDERTDVFSLGVVLYQLLTGSLPFVAKRTMDQFAKLLGEEPEPLRTFSLRIPGSVQAIVDRALAKNPDLRYSDGDAMAADLATALHRIREFGGAGAEFEVPGERISSAHPVARVPEAPKPLPAHQPHQPPTVEYDRSFPRQRLAFHPAGSEYALTIDTALELDWTPRAAAPDGRACYGTAIHVRSEVYELVAVERSGAGARRYCFRHWPESVVIRSVIRYTPEYVASLIEGTRSKQGFLSSWFGKRG